MKTLLIATQTGGVGKSALLRQLVRYLHFILQWCVLVIDQANSSRSLQRAHKASALSITASTLSMSEAPEVANDRPASW